MHAPLMVGGCINFHFQENATINDFPETEYYPRVCCTFSRFFFFTILTHALVLLFMFVTQGGGLCVIVNQKTFPAGLQVHCSTDKIHFIILTILVLNCFCFFLQDRLGTDRDRDELEATFTLFQVFLLLEFSSLSLSIFVFLLRLEVFVIQPSSLGPVPISGGCSQVGQL